MIRQAALAALISLLTVPAYAQDWSTSSGTSGSGGRQTSSTGSQGIAPSVSNFTGRNAPLGGLLLPPTSMGYGAGQGLAPVRGPRGRNGLPPTRLDSFVSEAQGNAWLIYGDEGTTSIPPFMEFTQGHRIERGINGPRAAGLTTSHGSMLPPAWGGDEYVDTEGFTQAGSPSQQVNPLFGLVPQLNQIPVLPQILNGGQPSFNFNLPGGNGRGTIGPDGITGTVRNGAGVFSGTTSGGGGVTGNVGGLGGIRAGGSGF